MTLITETPRGFIVVSKAASFPKLAEFEQFIRWDSRRTDYPDYLAVEKKS